MRGWIDRAGRPALSVAFIVAVLLLSVVGAAVLSAAQGEGSRSGRPLAPTEGVWFELVVTHPFSDWNDDGRVSPLDEHLVLRNHGPDRVALDGWVLHMLDGTDEALVLEGGLEARESLVVMNPPGRINNDVALRLTDDAGEVVDEVALGVDGVPDGRGGSVVDEAVHVVGPWAALRAPGSLGRGLGPVWVSHLAAEGTMEHADPFRPAWIDPSGGSLVLRVVVAPGHDPGPLELRAAGEEVLLEPADEGEGVWRTVAPLGPSHGNRSVELGGDGLLLSDFPSGDPLDLLVDPVVPGFVPVDRPTDNGTQLFLAAVAQADGSVRWFPPVETGASGLLGVEVRDEQDVVVEACVPLEEPGPGCLVDAAGNLSVKFENGAGRSVVESLPVEVWDGAPVVPGLTFEPAASPTMRWQGPSRLLDSLVVQVAQDPEGTWMVNETGLPVDALGFVDTSWVPGEPRAYRLVAVDLAGNEGVGAWHVLGPEDVPVQVDRDQVDLSSLGTIAEAGVTLRFDRPLQEPPEMTLRIARPVPLYLEVEGEPIVSEDAYAYQIVLPARIEEAVGAWSLLGGRGEDGAPVDASVMDFSWDARAPRVLLDGAQGHWIASPRHVLTVQAVDGVDPMPVVSFSGVPSGAEVGGDEASAQLVFHEEGSYEVGGTVRDASGNERAFVVRLGLDATPPEVREIERPGVWSSTSPLQFRVRDEGAGVNGSSLKVWARDHVGLLNVSFEDEGNGTWRGVPSGRSEPVQEPYEVYVAVADQAGNGVEGFLSKRMVRVPVIENHTRQEKIGPGPGPSAVAAPSFLGPPWGQAQNRSDTARGGLQNSEGPSEQTSRWDGFSWDDVPEEEKSRSWTWYVVALVGAVTLGTAVHRVHRHRNRSQRATPGKKRSDAPDGVEGPPAKPGQTDRTGKADDPMKTSGVAALPGRSDDEHGPEGSGAVATIAAAGNKNHPGEPVVGQVAAPSESVREERDGSVQLSLDPWLVDGPTSAAVSSSCDASFVVFHEGVAASSA